MDFLYDDASDEMINDEAEEIETSIEDLVEDEGNDIDRIADLDDEDVEEFEDDEDDDDIDAYIDDEEDDYIDYEY